MTAMQQALVEQSAQVLRNVRMGLTGDVEFEQAVALFRLARMVSPEPCAQAAFCWRDAVRNL